MIITAKGAGNGRMKAMIKPPLHKQSKSPVATTKRRIQKLLTEYVRLRDGGCVMRHYNETGACGGYTAADHIMSRAYTATYSNLDNLICLCSRHHIWWKPQHPTEYAEIVRKILGPEKYARLKYLSGTTLHMTAQDWIWEEMRVKKELKKLKAEE